MSADMANSLNKLAAGVGRSRPAVTDWVNHPEWDQPRKPPWNIAKAKAWAARTLSPDPAQMWRTEQAGGGVADGGLEALKRNPLNAARLKLALVRAEKLELERKILAGDYVAWSEIETALVRRAHAVRAAFQAIPMQVAGQLVGQDEARIEQILDGAIRAALTELADRIDLPEPSNLKETA